MNVASLRQKIALQSVQTGAAESDTLEQELAQLINWIIDNIANPPVGTVVPAALTEAQFTANKPAGSWVLCDGRNVAGSAFAARFGTNFVPDARGACIRGANAGRVDGHQNPDVTAVGGYQADAYLSHGHTPSISSNAASSNGGLDKDDFASWALFVRPVTKSRDISSRFSVAGDFTVTHVAVTGTPTDTESRVAATTVNFFMRIN